MSSLRRRSFSALLCPAGVHLVAHHRTRAGVQVEGYRRELRAGLSSDDVAGILANLLDAEGARGGRVSLAVTGFGSCHQIITLPRAERAVLQPIAARELRRFYPDLFADEDPAPIVDFVELDPGPTDGSQQGDLLVAGIPRLFVHSVVSELADRGVRVDHWTIAPRAMQRLYDAFADTERTAAALVMVPGWPLLGFFHDRELRLFSEPLAGPGASAAAAVGAVAEHVERGTIFLRQQFRGAAVSHLYLCDGTGTDTAEEIDDSGTSTRLPVTPFGPPTEPPGAFAALGAALDAAGAGGLNLLPMELRPLSDVERWRRRAVVGSACVLLAAAGWWGWSARRAESTARAEVAVLTQALDARRSLFGAARPIIEERQAHAQRTELIELIAGDRRRLPEVLWPLQAAAPDVRVRRLQVARQEAGWDVVLGMTAQAPSYEQATDAIMAVTQRLGAELPDSALTTSAVELDPAIRDGSAPGSRPDHVAASIEMSFIVPTLKEPPE